MRDFTLYYAAIAADDRYTRALVRVYGKNQSGDKRYQLTHTDPEICAARAAKHAADEAWLEEMRK